MDERALEAALNRLLGGVVAGVLKASVLEKARQMGTADPDRLLHGIEDVNRWLGDLLRESATGRRDVDLRKTRTQRSTSARKEEK